MPGITGRREGRVQALLIVALRPQGRSLPGRHHLVVVGQYRLGDRLRATPRLGRLAAVTACIEPLIAPPRLGGGSRRLGDGLVARALGGGPRDRCRVAWRLGRRDVDPRLLRHARRVGGLGTLGRRRALRHLPGDIGLAVVAEARLCRQDRLVLAGPAAAQPPPPGRPLIDFFRACARRLGGPRLARLLVEVASLGAPLPRQPEAVDHPAPPQQAAPAQLVHHRQPGEPGEQGEAAEHGRHREQAGAARSHQWQQRTDQPLPEDAARRVGQGAIGAIEVQRAQGGGAQQQQHQPPAAHRQGGRVPLETHLTRTDQPPGGEPEHTGPPQGAHAKQRIEHIGEPGTDGAHPVGDLGLRSTARPAGIVPTKAVERQ